MTMLLSVGTPKKDNDAFTFRKLIELQNDLGEGKPLTIQCKSNNKDILKNGENYILSFIPSIWSSTVYTCTISWEKVSKFEFDVYNGEANRTPQCPKSLWSARRDGIYHYATCFQPGYLMNNWIKVYDYENGKKK
ncbi:Plant self-incompatibility S1 [Macleaya cordata]|uniref:S-protein homolog n=1 Tax=Macleaya cordata TaxID=56857 RepID=A0A200QAB5_MACCD|nr:Plant self-incompatibility S1 [Macleaya cordata]